MSTQVQGRRIALFLPSLRMGGAERVAANLAKGFLGQGFRVDVVLAKAEGELLRQLPASAHVVDFNCSRVLFSLPKLVRYLRKQRPDAVLSFLSHCNVVALWARAWARVKTNLAVSEHGALQLEPETRTTFTIRLLQVLVRMTYPHADRVICVSAGLARDVERRFHLRNQQTIAIPNPIDIEAISVMKDQSPGHAWLEDPKLQTIVSAGRLAKEKDFGLLLRAFKRVVESRDARLIILGDGPERAKLQRLVIDLQLQDCVDLHGFVMNPYSYFRTASLFALSSRLEGFGNVLVEALACGARIVATACPHGPSDILAHGRYGSLVPVGDEVAFAAAILERLDSHVDQDELIHRAEEYSLATITRRYLDVLFGDL